MSVCRQSPPALRAGVTEGGREGGVLQRGAFGARYHLGAVSTSSLWDCGKDSHLPGHGGEGQGTPRTMWACVQFGDNAFLLLLTPGLSLILLCVCAHVCVRARGCWGTGWEGKVPDPVHASTLLRDFCPVGKLMPLLERRFVSFY